MSAPVLLRYEGDGQFSPANAHWAKKADAEFVVGDLVAMAETQDRSAASHRHFFVSLHELWLNLPERYGDRFPTSEHLRKYCLIKAGYHDQRTIVAASKAEALRLAAFVRPMDEFAVVTVTEATVTVYTAKSQSMRAMGKQDFQRSKDEVLSIAAEMVGLPQQEVA